MGSLAVVVVVVVVDDEVDVGELEVVVDVVVVSSSDWVVRVVVLELRLGEKELVGGVLEVRVRDGAVVSVGVFGSGVVLSAGSGAGDGTAVVVIGPAEDDGMIPAMPKVCDGVDVGSTGVLAGSTR
jgi:hypothetical protein